ncbi:MAG TPA: molybdopterin-guanine dinucleotide biosynthesis protein B [Desulfobacteraceae bacterium]|nr:molybdopterin-guanine dinucleotide biosynthesis protein B [Desulfobacteraceae bacterium]
MMPKMICIVGNSDSGKTTLIEKLIAELKRRGFRVGAVKHASHGFEIDKKGKDSWRHRAAGADTVLVASPGRIALVKNSDSDNLDNISAYFQDTDIVLVEGYKKEHKPKIEIFRKGVSDKPLFIGNPELIAFVSDSDIDAGVAQFGLDDIAALTDFIEKHL